MDAAWVGRRVYGSEPGDPVGPEEGHAYGELLGGPLDGLLLDVTGWTPRQVEGGALLMSDHGVYGPGGRSDYEPAGPDAGGDGGRYVWRGDSP
ncbi:hypothetical protein [Streptomyces sp. NPDC001568]|uniref:hypothetical protein n=1 Tax=Streptomyces sp. NPDC001568 TaxID=3364588 RepID=UPI0036BA7ACF